MTADLITAVTTQLTAAANAIATAWGLQDTLIAGEPTAADARQLPAGLDGGAVLVEFSGQTTGQFAIMVDADVAQALMEAPTTPPNLETALGPAITAAALALGDVAPGTLTLTDAASALRHVAALPDAGMVTLSSDGAARAVLIAGTQAPDDPASSTAINTPAPTLAAVKPGENRLDLLRGVNMQATVELGRAAMTINELLALREGAVIELDRSAGAPADLYVNGRLIAHGEVVVVDENYGLRVLTIVSDEVAG